MKPLAGIIGLLIMIYVVFAFTETVLCYVDQKDNSNSRYMANAELWTECRNDHLLFPLHF